MRAGGRGVGCKGPHVATEFSPGREPWRGSITSSSPSFISMKWAMGSRSINNNLVYVVLVLSLDPAASLAMSMARAGTVCTDGGRLFCNTLGVSL